MDKIILSEEKETLLIPLFGKARESKKKSPLLVDKKAIEIIDQIDYDFTSLKIPEKTNVMMCLRAKFIDNFVKDYLGRNYESIALHLGCGLDSRYNRIKNCYVDWYDVDFPEVIDIRRRFYEETDHYHLIGSSVTEQAWLENIPMGKEKYIVIAEGLFMYLKENEIKQLVKRLTERLGNFNLIFDAFSTFAAKKVKNHPSIKKTGAVVHWGIDNPEELESWGPQIRFVDEKYFTANKEIENLDFGTRTAFKIANLFPIARKAHRILIFQVG
jgi:O-methyltransferase involved in polyketide biosynthesis